MSEREFKKIKLGGDSSVEFHNASKLYKDGFKGVLFEGIFEKYVEENEDHLMELWDEYKYENYCGEYFHHDDVDYFNEEQFLEMAELVFNGELE